MDWRSHRAAPDTAAETPPSASSARLSDDPVPSDARQLFEAILGPYNQDPMWYFDKLNYGRPPAPWALACLDREYAIAGHVATSRKLDAGISFAPYSQVLHPTPDGFVPGVGVLTFANKNWLERSAGSSPVFAEAWNALRDCSCERRWLAILNPLSEKWLAEVLPGDNEIWLSSSGK